MNLRKFFVLICLLLFVPLTFTNQENDWQEWYNWYSWSFDCFYNYEYENSIKCLDEALKLDSSQPTIYWRLSYVLWLTAQREYDQKRKESSKEFKKRFDELTEKGIELCETLLKSNPNNSEILFYLGALHGHKGLLIVTTNSEISLFFGKLGKALKNINKSREILRPIAPFNNRALGYLGLYNYSIVLFPNGFKKKIKEDKNLSDEKTEQWGYEELQQAINAKDNRYSDDSIIMYKGLLQKKIGDNEFKDRIPEAIKLTENFLKRYRRNLGLKVDLVILYWKNGWLIEAKEMGEKLCNEILEHPDYPTPYTCYLSYKLKYEILPEIEKELEKEK